MMKKIVAFIFTLFVPLALYASPTIDILSDADESLYSQIFMLQDAEKISVAQKLEHQLSDPILMNEVLYQRYFSKSYHTKGAEVQAWMKKYNDMPGAARVEKLAKLKKVSVNPARVPSMLSGGPLVHMSTEHNRCIPFVKLLEQEVGLFAWKSGCKLHT